jgi:hypothetical protein
VRGYTHTNTVRRWFLIRAYYCRRRRRTERTAPANNGKHFTPPHNNDNNNNNNNVNTNQSVDRHVRYCYRRPGILFIGAVNFWF